MIPVATPEQLRAADASAPEGVDVLIERAGAAVARSALSLLGGAYGRRVVVVAGKGNNGADGRAAARRLRARGARVDVVDAGATRSLGESDLVVDAAYGSGFRGEYEAPDAGGAAVIAVDIPSGVDGRSGRAVAGAVTADVTVTFAALKPGLLFGDGPDHAGLVEVADIGLRLTDAVAAVVEGGDVASWLPVRRHDAHKWQTAVGVVAGSAGMVGAAVLSAKGAMRAGSGMVRLVIPGATAASLPSGEFVSSTVAAGEWAAAAAAAVERCRAVVVGPGLGRDESTQASVRSFVAACPLPVVVDADGLAALGKDARHVVGQRQAATVLTPHAGEFEHLAGAAVGDDPIDAARRLADDTGAVVLLKGSTTVVAAPRTQALLSTTGDARLATAGTGDVLSGVIGALLAAGVDAQRAAAAAAFVHGAAAGLGPARGLVAGDVVGLLPAALERLVPG